jgi:hypothetical protein
MSELPLLEEQRLIEDFRRWESALPDASRSLFVGETQAASNVVALRA